MLLVFVLTGCTNQLSIPESSEDTEYAFHQAFAYQYGLGGVPVSGKLADEWYKKAVVTGNSKYLNCYAFFLATTEESQYRDGEKAMGLMNNVQEKTKVEFYHKDTLAAVLAELGKYKEAAKTQEEAIRKMPSDVLPERRMKFHMRLNSYQKEKPWRE